MRCNRVNAVTRIGSCHKPARGDLLPSLSAGATSLRLLSLYSQTMCVQCGLRTQSFGFAARQCRRLGLIHAGCALATTGRRR